MKFLCFSSPSHEVEHRFTEIFNIVAENMRQIIDSGNSIEADRAIWEGSMQRAIQETGRHWIYAYQEGQLVAYLQYRVPERSRELFLEEIQVEREYQGDGHTFCLSYQVIYRSNYLRFFDCLHT